MDYKIEDDTLLHGISFNPMRLEGILKYGIVSENYALKHNINYGRNYNFTLNKDILKSNNISEDINEKLENSNKDNIFLVRGLYISSDPLSGYNMYIKNGISLIVESIPFIHDIKEEVIKRSDEVIVKDYIPTDKIEGIMIPTEYQNTSLSDVPVLPSNIVNYTLIKNCVYELIKYLDNYGYKVDTDKISYLLYDLGIANKSVNSLSKDSLDYQEAYLDYKDIIREINEYLSFSVYDCFTKILGHPATVYDMVEYINSKYDNKKIYIHGDNINSIKR